MVLSRSHPHFMWYALGQLMPCSGQDLALLQYDLVMQCALLQNEVFVICQHFCNRAC